MKILHVNYYDIKGGAAKAAYRLHRALIEQGCDSMMLVAEKYSDDDSVIQAFTESQLKSLHLKQSIESQICRIPKMNNQIPHSINIFSSSLPEMINRFNADVVNLHWINGCIMSIKDLKKLNNPFVWTLHDSWAYCGAEHHHKLNDESFKSTYKGGGFINKWTWRRKYTAWKNLAFNVVVPSRWLFEEAQNSSILHHHSIKIIPNGIDRNIFKPMNKYNAREELGINNQKKIIAFGAFNVNDSNKGGLELTSALEIIHQKYKNDVELLVIGKGNIASPLKSYTPGYTEDDSALSKLYSAADIFLLASKKEAFGNMLAEASACGTPCVAFDTGGIPDIIQHCKTGYVAKCFDPVDLAKGVDYAFSNQSRLGNAAMKYCIENFNVGKIATEYMRLYSNFLKNK